MSSRTALCAVLAAILATQPACVEEIKERCPLITENRPAVVLPQDFARLDDLLRHRALQMMHDAHQLHGSITTSFHIYFAYDTLPLMCARVDQARALAMAGQTVAAGRKYQALLVLSQLMELAIAVHATVEYADSVRELSLTLARTTETFGNQMKPLLEAALSEDPRRIEQALREGGPAIAEWVQHLERWTAHIRADAEKVEVAKAAWDISIGVIAVYEMAGALAEVAATGGPPVPPLPALAEVGGGVATMELSGAAYIDLAEAIRRLIASGALDAGIVAALSPLQMSSSRAPSAKPSENGAAGGERAGKSFTRVGKAQVKAENAEANSGRPTCERCGQTTVPAQQSRAGVTPPGNEAHVDHVMPKSKGGNGSPDNGQILCRDCNLEKGAK